MRARSLAGLAAMGLAGLASADPVPLPIPGPGDGALYTCPPASTQTIFVTVGSGSDPVPSVAVQTLTATVWPGAEQPTSPAYPTPVYPSLPPTLTVTIDSYGPPTGGSQYTGPRPWNSGAALTSTVYVPAAPAGSVASDPGNAGGNPPASIIPSDQVTPGSPDGSGRGTTTVYTFPGQTPPAFPWNPTQPAPGPGTDGVVVFSTTLYNTRPGSGGTPTVDTLVTCFTVTFPPATGTAPPVGPPNAGVSVGTVVVPTMVPGPDGSLSYSLHTMLSTFTPGVGTAAPPASVITTTYVFPGSPTDTAGQDPATGTPVVATITLTVPEPPATAGVSQPPTGPGAPGAPGAPGNSGIPSGPVTVTVIQPNPSNPAAPGTVFVTAGVPPSGGVPGTPGSGGSQTTAQSNTIPGSYGDSDPSAGLPPAVTVTAPAGSGNTQAPAGGLPGPVTVTVPAGSGNTQVPAGGSPVTVTVPAGSVFSQDPNAGLPSAVTVTVPAGSANPQDPAGGVPVTASPAGGAGASSILGGYSDPAQAPSAAPGTGAGAPVSGAPGSLGSPSVITLWPTIANTVQGPVETAPNTVPGAGVTAVDSALPVTGTKTSCTSTLVDSTSVEPAVSSVVVSSVLTSTLVNAVPQSTTTYLFPFESLVTSVSTAVFTGDVAGGSPTTTQAAVSDAGGAGQPSVLSSLILSTWIQSTLVPATAVSTSQATISDAGGAGQPTVLSSLILSTWVQSTLIQSTLVSVPTPAAVERRGIQKRQGNSTLTSTAPISVATPMCTGTTEVGTLTLDFDDLDKFGPIYNPYHRFWFSKGFLVGPPPKMPYLPSSGGQLVEFVPPMLSNSTGQFSNDTAQIGMGKQASSPCFQFNFYGARLGCDARVPDQLCEFTFTGYKWDAAQGNETEAVSQKTWVPSCPKMDGCALTPFSATGFDGLSSILVTLRVDGRPQVWWADDLQVGWTKNDCDSATCRQQPVALDVASDNDPLWYWTRAGMRVLKPSRIHKHF
ncbi:hypothetical protein CkaCkLH20_12124 [Colletotrichum karsti]|uniref:DUF7371 domain-containing protein n=1 Tax=Colletotrichum karsti TaxID=1095194 RepID=A0A9P6HV44_9PEZI|nr:uncharacterized protein CkaCkLH20_12124 [Colletotrichum karsti]KAF9870457.1 hypothetical protein CkaCkLH20_12124 [Colletotrichum karsti]